MLGVPLDKYPSTSHLVGSGLQKGEQDLRVPFSVLAAPGTTVAYEEKVDGANCAFRFDGAGELHAQARGPQLDMANRNAERDWTLFKDWLNYHRDTLLERFEDRYVVYGECMSIVHSISYDRLPGLFMEFDIYDLQSGVFLDTPARRQLCQGLPIHPVPVFYQGAYQGGQHMLDLVGPSVFRTPDADVFAGLLLQHPELAELCPRLARDDSWQASLRRGCTLVGDDYERRLAKLDASGLSEGIYVKLERDGQVIGRYKWVRPGFTQVIMSSNEHWQSRFPVPNLLDGPVDGLPAYLARLSEPNPVLYDADNPWAWAPWAPANPHLGVVPGAGLRAR